MPYSYNLLLVAASLCIAVLSSYLAMDLAGKMQSSTPSIRNRWCVAGSLAMGTGIWATHFIGMQAFKLPITLGYGMGLTALSWLCPVIVSGVALALVGRGGLHTRYLWPAALLLGTGIGTMHYVGMFAIDMSIPIGWSVGWVLVSVAVAVLGSGLAVFIFIHLMRHRGPARRRLQMLSATTLGLTICGAHYAGMAAAHFAVGSVCLSADALGGPELTVVVLVLGGLMLASTLWVSRIDTRLQKTAVHNAALAQKNLDLQRANEELQQRAFSDPLTGLPNRLLFEARLDHAVLRVDRNNHKGVVDRLAVMYLDLDGFKPVNDLHGHAAGDLVLKVTADRMRAQARESDTVARVGGDEFVMLIEDVSGASDCEAVSRRVLSALRAPFAMSGEALKLSASIGMAIYPDHGNRSELLQHADKAMYTAKRQGGDRAVIYDGSLRDLPADSSDL